MCSRTANLAQNLVAETCYEADGQTKSITYANGVTTTFTYSANRRWLNRVKTQTASNPNIVDETCTRDNLSRITGISGPAPGWTYLYDALNRLTKATYGGGGSLTENFVYAINDNLLSRDRIAGPYVYPAATAPRPHAPTSIGAATLTYDNNGNLIADGSRVMIWDGANRLTAAIIAVTSYQLSMTYGPDGGRAKKASMVAGSLYPDPSVEIMLTGIGDDAYIRYPHPDIRVQGSTKTFLHADHLASVRAIGQLPAKRPAAAVRQSRHEDIALVFQSRPAGIGQRHRIPCPQSSSLRS